MLAIHDQFTHQMCDRVKTTGIGLGLVRLLQDTRRFEDARTTLYSLENSFQGIESDKTSQKLCKVSRLKGDSSSLLFMPLSTRHQFAQSVY